MIRKLSVITALTIAIAFGGAFSSSADASAPIDSKQVQYNVLYSINGETGNFSNVEASNLVNKTLERLQAKFSNLDFDKIEKELNSGKTAPEKAAEKPAEKVEQPEQKVETPVEKKEEPVQKPQEPKEEVKVEPKAPAQKVEEPKAQPQQPAKEQEQPKQQEQQASALSQFESEVVELTNQERAKSGLQALQIDTELSKVAREKSKDMAANGYFDHNSPSYGSPFDMMKSFGIDYRTAGENIAKGQRTPQEVVTGWMNSPGHRENILNGNFTHIGVGYVEQGNHWTQQFIGK